ncbi:MAG TPA: hypothetical protein VKU02_18655 [Gemmataceae bacterium]|nr:hypothetical protein [Gemmataceae bacterium]
MNKCWLLCLCVLLLAGSVGFVVYPLLKPGVRRYCWLYFGPETKVCLLVCVEGEAISFAHYVDGSFTGQTERFGDRTKCTNLTIADPDGENCYTITRISGMTSGRETPKELLVHVDIKGPVEYHQYGDTTEMGLDPETAPMAHFRGPLTVGAATINWKLPRDLALQRGNQPTDVRALVGTFDAARRCWVVVRSESMFTRPEERHSTFPEGIHPVVDIEFPPKNPGDLPIKRRYALDQFC